MGREAEYSMWVSSQIQGALRTWACAARGAYLTPGQPLSLVIRWSLRSLSLMAAAAPFPAAPALITAAAHCIATAACSAAEAAAALTAPGPPLVCAPTPPAACPSRPPGPGVSSREGGAPGAMVRGVLPAEPARLDNELAAGACSPTLGTTAAADAGPVAPDPWRRVGDACRKEAATRKARSQCSSRTSLRTTSKREPQLQHASQVDGAWRCKDH